MEKVKIGDKEYAATRGRVADSTEYNKHDEYDKHTKHTKHTEYDKGKGLQIIQVIRDGNKQ